MNSRASEKSLSNYRFKFKNRYLIFAGFEEGGLGLRTLETNDPPTDGNGWVIFGLIIFCFAILGSVGFFFKERIIRYKVTRQDKKEK